MFAHFKTYLSSPVVACLFLLCIVIPACAAAATWQDIQNAISAAEKNRPNLSAPEKQALTNTLRPFTLTEQQFNEILKEDPTYFDNLLKQLQSFSGGTAAERGAERQKALADTRAAQPPNSATSCNFGGYLGWLNVFHPTCLARLVIAAFWSPLIAAAGGILSLAGTLFNLMVDAGIVRFGEWYKAVQIGIESGWSIFRDFANIAIIGIFTYVAISMIIGNEKFGTKRMVAQVLIVATLINFSLLFTKIILDVSHFVAREVYAVIDAQYGNGQLDTANGSQAYTTTGISNAYMRFARMSSAMNSWEAIRNQQEGANDGGFLFGLLTFIFFLAAALLLFYGSALILFRMVTLFILLLTSSIAFASWLWPGFNQSKYGWDGWWKQLLNNALFAPVLMIMLFITLNVASAMDRAWPLGERGMIGALASKPLENVGALVQFLIVLGLFYASLRIANALSAQWATTASAILTGGAVLNPLARLGGIAGRNTIGRLGVGAGRGMQSLGTSMGQSNSALARGIGRTLYGSGKGLSATIAKKDFNALQGTLGKNIAKQFGVSQSTLAGSKLGGIEGIAKKKAEQVGEFAVATAKARDEDGKKPIRQAGNEEIRKNAAEATAADKAHTEAEAERDKAAEQHKAIQTERQRAQSTLEQHQKARDAKEKERTALDQREADDKATAQGKHEIEIAGNSARINTLRSRITEMRQRGEDTSRLESEAASLDARHDELSARHAETLTQITKQVAGRRQQIEQEISALDASPPPSQAAIKELAAKEEIAAKKLKDQADAAARLAAEKSKAREKSTRSAEEFFKKVESGEYDIERMSGANKALAKAARDSTKSKGEQKRIADALKEFIAAGGELPKSDATADKK